MNVLLKTINSLTRITSWVAMATMVFIMFFIPVAVIGRAFNYPVLGDVEIVQLAMVVLIMFGLAYSQAQDAHISIGLLVDRFSLRIQAIFDVFGYVLTFIICWVIGWSFIQDALENMFEKVVTTDLLSIPFYPYKFFIAIGFILWGFQALLKVILAIISLVNNDFTKESKREGEELVL